VLVGTLVPLCRPTLDGSTAKKCCTNLVHKIGHRKNLPTSEVTQWHEQSTRVTIRLSTGKVQDPSQSSESATNNHQHVSKPLRYSKPSRWRQPPRVTRNPQPRWSSSAIRCNHWSKCTRNHSQSHYDDESIIEISRKCLLRLTRMLSMLKYQKSHPQAYQTLFYRCPQTNRAVRAKEMRPANWPDAPVAMTWAPEPASGRGSHATCQCFEFYVFDLNGNATVNASVREWPDAPLGRLDVASRRVRSFPETI
jgi:hypothetical protein